MRILVTGACGFVGSAMIRHWVEQGSMHQFIGLDNLQRPGSHLNREILLHMGVELHHGDVRMVSDLAVLPKVDFVIDAAANPSVLSGLGDNGQSRQLVEHNLIGTLNVLEYCRQHHAGLILLSTSRVYNIAQIATLPTIVKDHAFTLDPTRIADENKHCLSDEGIGETFSTQPPISLYGATKLASEVMALEYAHAFGLPVWINRCGVMAGAGQFARADQGIFSFWVHRWAEKKPLRYIGFGGHGHQVRDCLHPTDLCSLISKQLIEPTDSDKPRLVNVSGGRSSALSLAQVSQWCTQRFGPATVEADHQDRPYDLPWVILDHTLASRTWDWQPTRKTTQILEEIAQHASTHPNWLAMTGGAG